MTNNLKHSIPVPLFNEALTTAKKFAAQQETPEKRERVFLNTLAVAAVNTYLTWGEIETDLDQSYSYHPLHHILFPMGDLYLPKFAARLECCPVKPGENQITLPPNGGIIGYVAVQFQKRLDEVHLIGFLPFTEELFTENAPQEIPLSEFQSVESLFDHFFRKEEELIILEEMLAEKENDPVFERVRTNLANMSTLEIIAQLERIYRQEEDYLRGESGAKVLEGFGQEMLMFNREDDDDDAQMELQDFAVELIEKLAEIWEEN